MKPATLLALILAATALVACGDDAETPAPTSGSGDSAAANAEAGGESVAGDDGKLKFEVDPNGALAYTTTEASAPAGKVTFELSNPQQAPHDLTIEDADGKKVAQTYYLSETVDSTTANLKPGSYTFYCSFRGHRKAGMEGTLTIE